MPVSGIGGLGESLLLAFVQGSARRGLTGLFVPSQLTDSTSGLSGGELATLLGGARSALVGLATAATALDTANPTSVFFAATAGSSNVAAVRATVIDGTSVETTPTPASYTFTVSQLATAQANLGSELTSGAVSSFATGTNTLRVTQNGTTTDVSFSVGASDTNATVLASLASAINAGSGLGVTASVRTDTVAGTSQLLVEATTTGTANAFTLTDIAGTPGASAGVGSATTTATNASYTQNGVALTSSTNDLFLGDDARLHVTLLATTAAPVVVAVERDTDLIGAAVTSLVGAFNNAKALFDAHPDLYPGLAAQLGSAAERLGAQLANIGITAGAGGSSLSIDATRLDRALTRSPDVVQDIVGATRGLAADLRSIGETHLGLGSASRSPTPPFQAGYAPAALAGMLAKRFDTLRVTGLLVDQLI